jgi:integrase
VSTVTDSDTNPAPATGNPARRNETRGEVPKVNATGSGLAAGHPPRSGVPRVAIEHAPQAAEDLGGADWEKALIRAARLRGFLWRTEQTYREWGHKFASFLRPRGPYAASGTDVAAFLTQLAVEKRASAATQKQALNALVFLMQEGLNIQLGDFSGFTRANRHRRMPVVLTREECRALFARLEGTAKLMAQLGYGSGLRVSELIRLRVQDVDCSRLVITVRSGKGDRVKGFAHAVKGSGNRG